MGRRKLLIIDSLINLGLGVLLVIFPAAVARWLGIPTPASRFYVNILGAVFIGIALALVWEARRDATSGLVGLGTGGAAAINLCGGLMLAGWLVAGGLALTLAGVILLWLLAIALIVLSALELAQFGRAV